MSINIQDHHTDDEVSATLLHEMTHAAVGNRHQQHFLNELERLIGAGAIELQWEYEFYKSRMPGASGNSTAPS